MTNLTDAKRRVKCVDLSLQHKKIKEELTDAFHKVLESGEFILGKEVEKFEKQFAKLCNTSYAIGVNSGTDALIFALKALEIGPGDEVITVSNSFVATASCIKLVGAEPVFIDVKNDLNMDPSHLEKAITKKTKAIIPVHFTGRPADMFPILDFAQKHNLYVIEDAAQAVGTTYHNQMTGSFGIINCFSLHPLKNLNACGDAGIITTNSKELARKLVLLRNLGLESRENCIFWSSNSRLDAMQAAFLNIKIKYLNEIIEKRRKNAGYYFEKLGSQKNILLPVEKEFEKNTYHLFIIQAEKRDELKCFLLENGIETFIHYPIPIHLQSVGKAMKIQNLPKTELLSKQILSLPIHQDLTLEDFNYIAHVINQFYNR